MCTYQRHESLRRALDALEAQVGVELEWEVLIVDGDEPPGAARVTDGFAGTLRTVHEPVSSAAAARNRAVAEARGELLVFLDDDVVPEPGWLRALVAPLVDGRADAGGGRVLLDPAAARPRWFDEAGIGGYLARHDLGPHERELEPDEFVITANAAFRTALVRETAGFDPRLGPRPGNPIVNDDVQIVRDLRAAGARVRWVPDAVVVHELPAARLTRRYLLRRAYAQGRSDWILDREQLRSRRAGGSRVALGWLTRELRRRVRERPWTAAAAFHAACDVARTAGALTQAARQR